MTALAFDAPARFSVTDHVSPSGTVPDGVTASVTLAHEVLLFVPETRVLLRSVAVAAPLAR